LDVLGKHLHESSRYPKSYAGRDEAL
jgi:hypothetical protein